MLPFEKQNFEKRIFVCEFKANNNNYKIVRTILNQFYGCLVVNKVTYRNGKIYTNTTNKMELSRLVYGINTGYFKEVTNNK